MTDRYNTPFEAEIPGLARLNEMIRQFIENDYRLRQTQAENAPQAFGFQQGTIIDTAITQFTAGQPTVDQKFSFLVVIIESTAGAGRYRIDGGDPTALGGGIEIPAGGTVITIPGQTNIYNFKVIALTGQTMPFAMQGFK